MIIDMGRNDDVEGYKKLHRSIMGNMTSKDLKYEGGYSRVGKLLPINFVHFCVIHDNKISAFFKKVLKDSNLIQNGPWLTSGVYNVGFYNRNCDHGDDIWGWSINPDGEWVEKYPELGTSGMNRWKYLDR